MLEACDLEVEREIDLDVPVPVPTPGDTDNRVVAEHPTMPVRFAIVVEKQSGALEILGQLYGTFAEADRQASFHRDEWKGVLLKVAPCFVAVENAR